MSNPFHQYLEDMGFQADACESLEHPDFYALTQDLWAETVSQAARIRELEGENARLREALERVRCCEDAVCDQCLREVDAALEVKP